MEITKDTKISEILENHGDIPKVKDVFGIKNNADFSFRKFMAGSATIEKAAQARGMRLDELLAILNEAVDSQE